MLEKHLCTAKRDANGQVIGPKIPQCEAIKRDLMNKLERIQMPGNALDLIIGHFGADKVAEMTGRKHRIVTVTDANGFTSSIQQVESESSTRTAPIFSSHHTSSSLPSLLSYHTPFPCLHTQPRNVKGYDDETGKALTTAHEKVNLDEKDAFLNGEKRLAVISEAASSGISLHADHRFINQQRR